MHRNRLKTITLASMLLMLAGLGGCQDQQQVEAQQRLRDESIRFEAYTRGFRDGIYATVKHEMPDKKTLEIEPILAEMRPHEPR